MKKKSEIAFLFGCKIYKVGEEYSGSLNREMIVRAIEEVKRSAS